MSELPGLRSPPANATIPCEDPRGTGARPQPPLGAREVGRWSAVQYPSETTTRFGTEKVCSFPCAGFASDWTRTDHVLDGDPEDE